VTFHSGLSAAWSFLLSPPGRRTDRRSRRREVVQHRLWPKVPARRPPPPVPSPAKAAVGGATLLISSGLTSQAGAPNPLANHPYVLLRDSLSAIIVRSGV
jgi:hypothetical protein